MNRVTCFALAGAALLALGGTSAQALPVQADVGADSATILVAGGCGPYGHRGRFGECRPGGQFGGPGFRRGYGPGWRRGYGPGYGWRRPPYWHRRPYYY